jgi:hypothetical protein
MRHLWTILCTQAVVNETTKNISLFEIIDEAQLQLPQLSAPNENVAIPVQWHLVTTWVRSDPLRAERFSQRLSIRAPNGDTLMQSDPAAVELEAHLRMRTISNLVAMPLRVSGEYLFIVEHQTEGGPWVVDAEVPLGVKILIRTP